MDVAEDERQPLIRRERAYAVFDEFAHFHAFGVVVRTFRVVDELAGVFIFAGFFVDAVGG